MLQWGCPDNIAEESTGILDCNNTTGQVLLYTKIPNMSYILKHDTKNLTK